MSRLINQMNIVFTIIQRSMFPEVIERIVFKTSVLQKHTISLNDLSMEHL